MLRATQLSCLLLATLFSAHAFAQSSTVETDRCYNKADPKDIRLWDDTAPGAVGSNPCTDIPFVHVVTPERARNRTALAIVLMPGGGYNRLTDTEEQEPVARYFADHLGITTFILYYRLVQANGTYRYPVPMWDAQRAIRLVRSLAGSYNVNPDTIGAFGFSAGGHLASTVAIHFDSSFGLKPQDSLDTTSAAVNFLGLGYPVISMEPAAFASPNSLANLLNGYTGPELTQLEQYLSGQLTVNKTSPPTFLFESWDDKQISSENSTLFCQALNAATTVPFECHIFEKGLHGDGLARSQPAERHWPRLFEDWLRERKLLPTPAGPDAAD